MVCTAPHHPAIYYRVYTRPQAAAPMLAAGMAGAHRDVKDSAIKAHVRRFSVVQSHRASHQTSARRTLSNTLRPHSTLDCTNVKFIFIAIYLMCCDLVVAARKT